MKSRVRQNSWFNHLFGVKEPGFYGIIEVDSRRAFLFAPRIPPESEIWLGRIVPLSEFREMYGVDEVRHSDEMQTYISDYFASHTHSKLFVLSGVNTDSGNTVSSPSFPFNSCDILQHIDSSPFLFNLLSEIRVIKSDMEKLLMRYCALAASEAHVTVMRNAKAGMMEYELEAWFLFHIYSEHGCRFTPYTCICACGPSSSTLHYGHAGFPNNRRVAAGDMALLDMGAEFRGYASDITCSFPVSGKFNENQRVIYEGVLAAQMAVLAAMKPGVSWCSDEFPNFFPE